MSDQDTQLEASTQAMTSLGESSRKTLHVTLPAVQAANKAFDDMGRCMKDRAAAVERLNYNGYHLPTLTAVQQTVDAFARTLHGIVPVITKAEKYCETAATTVAVTGGLELTS